MTAAGCRFPVVGGQWSVVSSRGLDPKGTGPVTRTQLPGGQHQRVLSIR